MRAHGLNRYDTSLSNVRLLFTLFACNVNAFRLIERFSPPNCPLSIKQCINGNEEDLNNYLKIFLLPIILLPLNALFTLVCLFDEEQMIAVFTVMIAIDNLHCTYYSSLANSLHSINGKIFNR